MTEDDQRLRSGLIAGLTAYLVWGALTVYWKLLAEFDPFELVLGMVTYIPAISLWLPGLLGMQ